MLSIDDLRFFATVASLPTLAAAARALDVTPPAVSQRLRQLEARLRVHLVDEDVTLWRFTGANDQSAGVRIDPVMASNDGDIVHGWALAGLGIVVRSEWDVAGDLRAGRLTRVLPEWRLPVANVTAQLGERRQRRAARTNRFLEFLRASLAAPPWRD